VSETRGILRHAAYVPHHRLARADIAAFWGAGGGSGTRAVASFDEDTTTMGVEAARVALTGVADASMPTTLHFATADPAYLDKTNATTIHAALGLADDVAAFDVGGAVRSGSGAVLGALRGAGRTLVVTSDRRSGLPTGADEREGGDAAAALLIGSDADGALAAQFLGSASATREVLDRWRTPGEQFSRTWEERFGERAYLALGSTAWKRALAQAGVDAADVDHLVVAGTHARATRAIATRLGVRDGVLADDLQRAIGNAGTAHPWLMLSGILDVAEPGATIAVLVLADGADCVVLRTTEHVRGATSARPVRAQIATGGPVSYAKFLRWRGQVQPEPPRRPEPQRPSASAIDRRLDWKLGFVGARDRTTGVIHLPPSRAAMGGGAIDDMEPVRMADIPATIVTWTVDHVSYSLSPPVLAAVVDFDGGGRFPTELCDCTPDELAIGTRVEMTFRRLHTADGIHNYFWKARPIRDAVAADTGSA
jgi:3-hydroxy-3-methylglutaryl CoA synthase/uncharacterized OB-fold protein